MCFFTNLSYTFYHKIAKNTVFYEPLLKPFKLIIMKKYGFFLLLFAMAAFLISGTLISNSSQSPGLPEDINKIVEKSCYGCHNTDSQNEDAKEELDFNTLNDLRKVKKITTLREIAEVLEKGEMPPKKMLEKYPDRKPTEEEIAAMIKWAKKESEALIGN